jgi:cystathionine gamma-synthase
MKTDDRFHSSAATLLAHAGGVDGPYGSIVPVISPATTFVRDPQYQLPDDAYIYSRSGTPNWRMVEALLTELEGGFDSHLFSSGLAAATVLFQTLAPGNRVVIPDAMYHGLRDWLEGFCANWGIEIGYYRAGDTDSLCSSVNQAATHIVWVETPSNPTWEVTDIELAARIAHAANALCVVDSTVATPLITRPLDLGADFVVHSATKYLNGHSDVLGGVVVAARDCQTWRRISQLRTGGGAVLGAFEAWLLLRGLRTLDVRLERAVSNAGALAAFLVDHPGVEKVLYPGLASHPGHAVACRQMRGGFGAMLSILVAGDADRARRVAGATRLFRPATSLGGVESLIEHRATVEGPNSPVPKNLLRLSVGIESQQDLVSDIDQALRGT